MSTTRSQSHPSGVSDPAPPTSKGLALPFEEEEQVDSSESGSSDGSDSSESGSDDQSEDESESESEGEAAFTAKMKQVLLRAKKNARAAQGKGRTTTAGLEIGGADSLENQDEVVKFGTEEGEGANTSQTREGAHGNALSGKSISRAEIVASTSKETLDKASKGPNGVGGGDKWGKAPMKSLSKKERKERQPRTAGPKWFNLPAPTMTPELKREVQAMRMRNSLDPKRFYRGGAKEDKKLPEFFSLGHVIESSTRATTLTPAIARKRTFVEELVEDDQARAYTKRKTVEVMARGMSGRQRQKKGAKRPGKVRK